MTEKKPRKEHVRLEGDPRFSLAVLLYRYMGSKEACNLSGLPDDRATRNRVSSYKNNHRWARAANKIPLETEPISHVTLIADGWKYIDRLNADYKFDDLLLNLKGGGCWLSMIRDQGNRISNEGICETAFTIGDLREYIKSLSL